MKQYTLLPNIYYFITILDLIWPQSHDLINKLSTLLVLTNCEFSEFFTGPLHCVNFKIQIISLIYGFTVWMKSVDPDQKRLTEFENVMCIVPLLS